MTDIQQEVIKWLEGSFTTNDLAHYVVDLEIFLAFDVDELDTVNPKLADYIQDVVPMMTSEEYDDTKQKQWLDKMRKVVDKAKKMVIDPS